MSKIERWVEACMVLAAAGIFFATRESASSPASDRRPATSDAAPRRSAASPTRRGEKRSRAAVSEVPEDATIGVHSLSGNVREVGGRVLAGAVVRATAVPVFPEVPVTRKPVEAVAGADGAFDLRGLSAGVWALDVSADGAVNAAVATVRVPDIARFDLVLPRGAVVAGTLVDDATRVAVVGARVRLADWADGAVGEGTTDVSGRFEIVLHREVAGFSLFRIEAPGYLPTAGSTYDALEFLELRDGERRNVALVAYGGATLTGTVTGPDGPVAGARVTLAPHNVFLLPPAPRETTTDAAGQYRFEHVESNTWLIRAEADGLGQEGAASLAYANPAVWTNCSPESARVGIPYRGAVTHDLRMVRANPVGRCTIEGRVEEEDGRPIEGASVATRQGALSARATTGADGKFVLADVPTEGATVEVSVRCEHRDEQAVAVAAPAGGRTTDVVFKMGPPFGPARARGRVVAGGAAVAGARVVIVLSDVEQFSHFQRLPYQHVSEGRTADDGSFDVPFAGQGDNAAVVVEAAGFPTCVSMFEAAQVNAEVVEIVLRSPVTISGRVVRNGTDDGVGGVAVALVGPDRSQFGGEKTPASSIVAVTAADGSFRVAWIPPGKARLSFAARGWDAVAQDVDAPSTGPVRIEMCPAK